MSGTAMLEVSGLDATVGTRGMCKLRGARIGMVFQEPMISLNPSMTIGERTCRPGNRTEYPPTEPGPLSSFTSDLVKSILHA